MLELKKFIGAVKVIGLLFEFADGVRGWLKGVCNLSMDLVPRVDIRVIYLLNCVSEFFIVGSPKTLVVH